MWVEIICGLVVYKLLRTFFFADDPVPDADSSDSGVIFSVASRLEKAYGGKAFVGLRIPDQETGSRRHIDIVLVTKRTVMVVAVRSFHGFVDVGKDGSWVCTSDSKHRPESFPDPILEIHRQLEIVEAYLEQRGVILPKGYMIGKVILPNPNCRVAHSITIQPEVVSFDEWTELKPESKVGLSSWFKDAIHGAKGETHDNIQKINFVLNTAPMWDRLELRGDKNILGEFMEFRGNQEDMQALNNVKRSKVSQIIIQKASLFGLGRSRVPILYSERDYRSEGMSTSEWREIAVKPSTEILFHPFNAKKPKKFKITSIVSVLLSG